MHFNSSCSYAGLANMLELLNHDTEDFKIALEIGLPYFVKYDSESECYQAGAMLQSKEWYDLYLKPRGFSYIQQVVSKTDICSILQPGMMLGVQINRQLKHAIVFINQINGIYSFINNKWEESQDVNTFEFTKDELLDKLAEKVVVGSIKTCECEKIDFLPYYIESISTWKKLKLELQQFTTKEQSSQNLYEAMDRLFRPLLVDGLAMMKLLDEQQILQYLESLQKRFIEVVKRNQKVVLADEFNCSLFDESIDMIIDLVYKKIKRVDC